MIELHYGKPSNNDFDTIIDMYSGSKINSVRTSTFPLLAFWKDTKTRLNFLLEQINVTTENSFLCFEYPTSSGAKGKSSMTDLMILTDSSRIAIEAKFTEVNENYQIIDEWLKTGKNENKKNVLQKWIEMIEPFSNGILRDKLNTIPYQFLHRTASACKDNSDSGYVVYQLFYDDLTKKESEKFKSILINSKHIINPNNRLKILIWEIEVNQKITDTELNTAFQKIKSSNIYEFKKEVFNEV